MSVVQGQADFVIVHWYPGAGSAADSLTKMSQISGMMSTLRSLINQFAGSRASSIGVAVTEMNPSFQLNSATAALFAADSAFTWFENGAMNLDWWNTHNGTSTSPGTNEDGTPDYHDEGILSSAGTGEPAVNTPFPPYYGLSMVGRAGAPGDTLVQASSSTALLATHAIRTPTGLNVLLVNKDPANSTTVSLAYSGFTPTGTVSVTQWQKGATSISSTTQASATSITVPPYSITVLKSGGGTGGGDTTAPSAPTGLAASGTTSTSTNLSWTASTDNVGVAGYDILRAPGASGGTFAVVGTSTTTSFANTGLTASTTYRYQVRARDAAGNVSAVSNTAQVTTSAGGSTGGPCTAVPTVQSQWSTGYVIQPVTVTNTGTATITSWTVTITLPAGHALTGSWNATVTTSGQTVTAKSVAHNGTLAPGASTTSFGFQGSRPDGNTALPSAYTCTTP
ncbi:cellulose binding domain-containing protein [Streptosporangiaceae bacterium NEAU-GS5]|nr:cellulose binding domain-containing protein [Streptosporangiaceae bacterium NEAU-GS5]